jgi:hypothetical protein
MIPTGDGQSLHQLQGSQLALLGGGTPKSNRTLWSREQQFRAKSAPICNLFEVVMPI